MKVSFQTHILRRQTQTNVIGSDVFVLQHVLMPVLRHQINTVQKKWRKRSSGFTFPAAPLALPLVGEGVDYSEDAERDNRSSSLS